MVGLSENVTIREAWPTTGADRVDISGVGTNLPLNGSRAVSPTVTTTYTLSATAGTGADARTVTAPVVVIKRSVGKPLVDKLIKKARMTAALKVQLAHVSQNAFNVVGRVFAEPTDGKKLPGVEALARFVRTVPGLKETVDDVRPIPITVVCRAFLRALEGRAGMRVWLGRDLW